MKKSSVYFLQKGADESDGSLAERLSTLLSRENLLRFIAERDFVAIKTHFGEAKTDGYVRPQFIAAIAAAARKMRGVPFLTETSTLYTGRRSNAVEHLLLAAEHKFTSDVTGVPVIMADGLLGDEEIEVGVDGEIFRKVRIAALLKKVQSLIVVTHFTGHIVTGFGAALKNIGMGLASRRGKMKQHSTLKPAVREKKCTGCAVCTNWCPVQAITLSGKKAVIDPNSCIGCGECLAVCRYDAIAYNWSETQHDLQKKMVEHAAGVLRLFSEKRLFLNFLLRITKDCDCMAGHHRICDDIGILVSNDPVAIDAASRKLVEEKLGAPLASATHKVDSDVQLEYAARMGLGSLEYELVTLSLR